MTRNDGLSRRRFLGAAASVSAASLVAGCGRQGGTRTTTSEQEGGNRSTTTRERGSRSTPTRVEKAATSPNRSAFLAALLPTVAIKTTSGQWIPRPVRTEINEPGWEVAIGTGRRYNPAKDGDPPSWLSTWVSNDEIEDTNTYFDVPGRLVVSPIGMPEDHYPVNPEVSTSGGSADRVLDTVASGSPSYLATEGDQSDTGTRTFSQLLEVTESSYEAGWVSPVQLSANVLEESPFHDDVQNHPRLGENDRITSRTDNDYGVTVTTSDEYANVLAQGWKKLARFHLKTFSQFNVAGKLISNALFLTLGKSALTKITMQATRGSTKEAIAAVSEVVNDGQRVTAPENLTPGKLNGAQTVTGSIFFPPVSGEMRTALDVEDLDLETAADVEIADAGIGFSGPMLYLADRNGECGREVIEGFESTTGSTYRPDAGNTGPSRFTRASASDLDFGVPQGDAVGRIDVENTLDGWWADTTAFGRTIERGDRLRYFARNTREAGAIQLEYWRNTGDEKDKALAPRLSFQEDRLVWIEQTPDGNRKRTAVDQQLRKDTWYRVEVDVGEFGDTHTASLYREREADPLTSLSVEYDGSPGTGIEWRYGWYDLTGTAYVDGLSLLKGGCGGSTQSE